MCLGHFLFLRDSVLSTGNEPSTTWYSPFNVKEFLLFFVVYSKWPNVFENLARMRVAINVIAGEVKCREEKNVRDIAPLL